MKSKVLCFQILTGLLCCLILSGKSMAADFPNKPIEMIVGFRAGGSVDTMGRILAEEMTRELGQPVVVQNKAGGGGNLATTVVKNNDADGYTISVIPSQQIVFNPKALKTKYTADDFSYIGAGASFQEAFVSLPDLPYNNFKEMIDWAKKNDKKLRYASMTPMDMAITNAISKDTGVIILPVPTKGGAAIMVSVLGGHVDFGFSGGLHYSYVKAGRMKVLMAMTSKPLVAFPDVSTVIDNGWNLAMDNYMIMFVCKEVPENIKKILADAAGNAFKSKKFIEVVNNMNLVPEYLDPSQSAELIEKTKKVIDQFEL